MQKYDVQISFFFLSKVITLSLSFSAAISNGLLTVVHQAAAGVPDLETCGSETFCA
jgi:hypothetical protein